MANDLTIPFSDETPAFNALTELQKRFVLALLQFGSAKGQRTKCARFAGYQGDDNTLHVVAHQQFHNNKIKAALREMTEAHLMSFQLMAVDGIASMAETARDEGVKLKALLALADRTGFQSVQQIKVQHEDMNRSQDQMLDQMVALILKHPEWIDRIEEPRRSLVQAKIEAMKNAAPQLVTDAEFVELDPDAALLGE